MRLNSAGLAAYGFATIAIDGAIPSTLASTAGGGYHGPNWLTDTKVFYQTWSTPPPFMQSYDTGSHALATLGSGGASFFAAGGGVWAKSLSGVGVTTSVGGVGPFPLGSVADVSPDGEIALFTANGSSGLTVYSSAGATLLSLPDVVVVSPQQVRIRNHIMAYQTSTGWHLRNVLTGATPFWYPRADAVGVVVPVTIGSTLYVVEAGSNLGIRPANNSIGYVLETAPVFFNPDAVMHGAGVARVGYCANSGESVTSLIETDVTVASGVNQRGTVVGSTVVFTPGTPFARTTFSVGPSEGTDLTNKGYPPLQQAPIDPENKQFVKVWKDYFRDLTKTDSTLSGAIQAIPSPVMPAKDFGVIAADGQPALTAQLPADTLALTSSDGSVLFTADPSTQTLDLRTSIGAGGLVPMTTGSIPPNILFIGADVMMIRG